MRLGSIPLFRLLSDGHKPASLPRRFSRPSVLSCASSRFNPAICHNIPVFCVRVIVYTDESKRGILIGESRLSQSGPNEDRIIDFQQWSRMLEASNSLGSIAFPSPQLAVGYADVSWEDQAIAVELLPQLPTYFAPIKAPGIP
jgi:hypothetical protein